MYSIHIARDGTCVCECRIQDGVERFPARDRVEATYRLISAARVLNHDFIRETDIQYHDVPAPPAECPSCAEWRTIRNRLSRGEVRLMEATEPTVQYKITVDECETILALREGRLVTTHGPMWAESEDVDRPLPSFDPKPGEVLIDDPLLGYQILRYDDPRLDTMSHLIVKRGTCLENPEAVEITDADRADALRKHPVNELHATLPRATPPPEKDDDEVPF